MAAVRGGTAELICNAEGAPPLRYEWYHNGKRIQSTRLRRITNTGNLYFFQVTAKRRKIPDTGSYYCTVTNNFGRVKSQTVNLTIGCK